ncbi:protease pro-enzyme activation domain-containing protein [Granulicella sp. S156]|uniref:protease pro-enzyme activation domain-containing protein n=1 Tax=Granulicella sp. S156 TaxID=1747224 RepID=UPI00131D0A19|nr:protease pro-enzyme activation domain-containing protein [Granulicella sp. S156]
MPSSRLARFVAASALFVSGIAFSSAASSAQSLATPQARITAPINGSSRFTLTGSHPARAVAANDIGALPASTKLTGITFVFSRTAAQQTALDALVAAQQNPASPLYHQWLTPTQFGAQFGAAASDIAAVESWLQQQGFTVDSISNSRDRIHFSGTAALVESAFGAPLHYYRSGSETHFSPANDLTLPSALASSVLAVTNLSDYRPRTHVKVSAPQLARPNFTSSQTGSHYLTPGDIATIYDINPAYSAGYTGTNQTIAIVGQSFINTSDITNFQTAAGLTNKTPTLTLVPNTGSSAINPVTDGDEVESDLDIEYSGAIAKGATINFVYTGNSQNNGGAFQSLEYAIDSDLAPIVSSSYGDCETDLSTSGTYSYASLNAVLEQGASQGQTIISAAGDDGSTDCSGDDPTVLSTTQQEALAVDFPASSQYVTGLGGTEFPATDVAAGNNTYFAAETSTDIISSALSYIPEQVWNDDSSTNGLSSGGGGVSALTSRPSWQAGVTGIPTTGSFRLVPDVSLDASPNNAGYLYCSSDSTDTGITGSCSNGFRDANDQYLTVAGGTSFAAPIFAGMVAIINQAKGYNTGQGLVNPELYTLASSTATYGSAFHDITSGNNECLAGLSYPAAALSSTTTENLACVAPSTTEYPATTGYDEASGLGSVDLYQLVTAWAPSTSALLASTTTVSAATLSPAISVNDTITVTIGYTSGSVTPTGTVAITDNGTAVSGSPFTLVNGAYTYTYSTSVSGAHTIIATYSGDSNYASSKGSVTLNVGGTSFTIAASNVTITAGSSGTSTVTITPVNGYTGTVDLTLTYPSSLTNFCVAANNLTVVGAAAVSETITFYTSVSTCNSNNLTVLNRQGTSGTRTVRILPAHSSSSSLSMPTGLHHSPWKSAPFPAAFACLLIAGCFRHRSRLLRGGLALVALVMLSFSGFGLMGCSSGSSSVPIGSSANNAPAGTYSFTVTGTDSVNSTITNNTSFNVIIQ